MNLIFWVFPNLLYAWAVLSKNQYRMQRLWLLIIIFVILTSCNSTKPTLKTNDAKTQAGIDSYLVFGKFYGHCISGCATLFKLENDQLFADELLRFTDWEALKFKTTPLSNQQYQAAKALLDAFPQELLQAEETIGCPDCADQGGFALEIRKDGKRHHWRIDTNRNNLPDYLKAYVDQIDKIVAQLN